MYCRFIWHVLPVATVILCSGYSSKHCFGENACVGPSRRIHDITITYDASSPKINFWSTMLLSIKILNLETLHWERQNINFLKRLVTAELPDEPNSH